MGIIDEYYKQIEDRIDRCMNDLSIIKNYDSVVEELEALKKEYADLELKYKFSQEGLHRFKESNEGLSKELTRVTLAYMRVSALSDPEIQRLRKGVSLIEEAEKRDNDDIADEKKDEDDADDEKA